MEKTELASRLADLKAHIGEENQCGKMTYVEYVGYVCEDCFLCEDANGE